MLNKIAVLVSGTGTNLKALIEAIKNNEIKNGKISLVISSNKNAKAIAIAREANINTVVLDRKSFKLAHEFEEALFLTLKEENPNLIVMAGFLCIIPKKITDHFKNKIINIHPSLIPAFCGEGFYGLKVHEAALKKGVKITGATVHFVNEIADGGPIILQKSVEVKQTDSPEILQKRVMEQAEWVILKKAVNYICLNKIYVKDNKTFIEEE